jgi:modulator of FtsH protease HflC
MKKLLIVLLLLILIPLGIWTLFFFVVDQTEYAILTQFGKPVKIIEAPGLYKKRPGFLETVLRYDKRIRTFSAQPIQLLLGDKNPLILTCYICWKIDDPLLYSQSIGDSDIALRKTGDMVNSLLGSVLGDYTIANIINTNQPEIKLAEIEKRITTKANENAHEKYGIEITSVGISRINYPSIVAQAVYKRMEAEREKEAIRYRAEGREQATIIRAETDRQVSEILSEAYRSAEVIKGKGDQTAMNTYAEAYSQDPAFFEFMKNMELYEQVLGGRSTLILSTETELFKHLLSAGEGHP